MPIIQHSHISLLGYYVFLGPYSIVLLTCVSASWYKINVNEVVDEDLKTGADTPRSVAYVINGQPGDFCDCSKGTYGTTLRIIL